LPLRMQEVQARMRLLTPFTMARTGRRFTFQRRLVTLWAWLILLPNCGPLPQTSHTRGIETPTLLTPDQRLRPASGGDKTEWMELFKYKCRTGFGQAKPSLGSHHISLLSGRRLDVIFRASLLV